MIGRTGDEDPRPEERKKAFDFGLLCWWTCLAGTTTIGANGRQCICERCSVCSADREAVELRSERFVMTEEDTKHEVEDKATFHR